MRSEVLKASQDGDYKTSLSNHFHYFLMIKKIFLQPEFILIPFMSSLSHPPWNRLPTASCEVSISGDIQNPMDTDLDKLLPLVLFEQGGWDRWSEEDPSNPNDSIIISWHPPFRWKALLTIITLKLCYILFHNM